MTVLLTNDDGILSPGLEALVTALSPMHDVWVVAPDGERSGFSSKITITEPIRCKQVGEQRYAVSGSPADCVILGTRGAIPVKPEVVVSGINIGPNLGTDIVYSGTCAAARQATFSNIPGIALSVNAYRDPFHFAPLANYVADHLEHFVRAWDEDHFLNINAPNVPIYKDVVVTTPAVRRYDDWLVPFEPPRGGVYYFVDGGPRKESVPPGTDWYAVERGELSLTPVLVHPVNHPVEERYRDGALTGSA